MWFQLPSITMKKLRVKPATWVRVGDPEPGHIYIRIWVACAATQWHVTSGPNCSWGPYLCPWPHCSQGLCWCTLFLLPSKAMQTPKIKSQTDVSGPYHHWRQWWHPDSAAAKDHVGVHGQGHLRRPQESWKMKSEGYTESVPPLIALWKLTLPLAIHYSKRAGPCFGREDS